MPALVNYSGDDDLYPMELGRLYAIVSNLDLYYPPSKRARVMDPFNYETHESEQDQKPTIEVLPDECLFEIFRRLPGGKERTSCAGVSKKWLMLMSSIRKAEICKPVSSDTEMNPSDKDQDGEDDDGCLTRCLEGRKANDVRLAAVVVGTSGRGGLGKLSIKEYNSSNGVTNVGLSAVGHGCPSLRSLALWNVSSVGDEGLIEIAKGCHMLEKLDLCQISSITDKSLIAIAEGCPNLTTLSIESCRKIGNEGLQAVAKFCPNLQSIFIKGCPLVGDQGVSSLFASAPNLSIVTLQSVNITDLSMAFIGHYGKSVTSLVLTDLRNVSEKGFWVMGFAQGMQKLISLTITSCQGVSDASIEGIGKGCINLKQLYLRKCYVLSDNGLVAFAKIAGSLESLYLDECSGITQSGIIVALSYLKSDLKSLSLVKCKGIKDIDVEASMLSPCMSLQSLTIRNCPSFGSSSLAMIGKLCPQLQYIDFAGLYGITDAGLLPLLENNEAGLVKVNLTSCWNLTDYIVSDLVRLHGGTLELLNLAGCMKITDASLAAIASDCLLLTELDVSKSAITDSGLAVLSGARHLSLRVLSLSGCYALSNKSVPFLKKLGRSLSGLNIQNCNSIARSKIMSLMESLFRCDILA